MGRKDDKMATNKIKRIAIYIRVSTDKQARKGDSLAEQEDTLRRYVDDHEDMILHSVYVDDGISGQKINRDEFSRLIDDVKSDNIDIIIFTKLDRWFRSLKHYLNTQDILEKHNVAWLAVSQPFYDTTTAQGRAFVAQSMTFAELEAQVDSERILSTFEYKVKVGEVISGTTPLGYDIVDKHLVPNQDAWKVKAIYEQYQKNPNLRALMRFAADELGIVRGHAQFKRLMQNTKYKGVYRNNNSYCPAIVSDELWDECNRLLSRNQRMNKKHDYVFSGLITCSVCGRRMSASTTKKKVKKRNDNYTYEYPAYRCQGRMNGLGCTCTKQYFERTIETRLLSKLKDEINSYIVSYEICASPSVDIRKKKNNIENKIKRLKDLYLDELISLEEYKEDKIKYENMIAELPEPKVENRDLSYIKELLNQDIETLYKEMDTLEKNRFWRSFLADIRIDNEHNIELVFK